MPLCCLSPREATTGKIAQGHPLKHYAREVWWEMLEYFLSSATILRSLRRRLRKVLKGRKMLDWCTRPRMLLLVSLLLICSLFILLFGEYVEENLGANTFIRRQSATQKPETAEKQDSQICPSIGNGSVAEPILVQKCQKCTEFEQNALKIEYCHSTGFFDAYTCPTANNSTGSTVYKPCLSHVQRHQERAFYLFALCSFLSTATFWTFVRWRKDLLERRSFAYQRLGNAG